MLKRGVLARGIILQADAGSREGMYQGRRFERRLVTLDVELTGRAPYQTRLNLRIPRIVEALPGATLDLRVNPRDPDDIEVLGPLGACGWLNEAAAVPEQTWGAASYELPDDAAVAPFIALARDDPDEVDVRAIRGHQRAVVVAVIVLVTVLAVAWELRLFGVW